MFAINTTNIPEQCQEYVSELKLQLTEADTEFVQSGLPYVISAFREGSPECMSLVFEYPFEMPNPLPPIKTPTEMVKRIAEVVDDSIQLKIAQSSINNWSTMGWKGSMLENGIIWIAESGGIFRIHYETAARKTKIESVLAAQQKNLHPSLHEFESPILSWNSKRFNIRVDQLVNDQYRYAVWKGSEPQSSKPDLILNNGQYYRSGGSMSYPEYQFRNGKYIYTIGQSWTPNWPDGKIGQLIVEKENSDGSTNLLTTVDYFENDIGMNIPMSRNEFVEDFINKLLQSAPLRGRGQDNINYKHIGTTDDLYSENYCDRSYELNLTNIPVEQFTELLELHIRETFTWEKENWPNMKLQFSEYSGVNQELMTPVDSSLSIDVINVTVDEPGSTFLFYFTEENGVDKLIQVSRKTLCMP
ncbi:hypothetical protein QWZ13_12210 [Reinekea marina]|uniref:hypothetical protein n=1 Tax=Reinekea marina TaxID=1310421 RepID=UPI0025B47360|nr:hypothetical protein [Reinekea marina]MDN3649678.1 hypothetical protein [Reinekea marina]